MDKNIVKDWCESNYNTFTYIVKHSEVLYDFSSGEKLGEVKMFTRLPHKIVCKYDFNRAFDTLVGQWKFLYKGTEVLKVYFNHYANQSPSWSVNSYGLSWRHQDLEATVEILEKMFSMLLKKCQIRVEARKRQEEYNERQEQKARFADIRSRIRRLKEFNKFLKEG